MEFLVEGGEQERIEVIESGDHPLVDRAGLVQVGCGESARGQGGRGALQDAQGHHAVAVLRLVDHRDLRAHVVLEGHEFLGLELADRLTHGNDAHVEFLGDGAEHQPVAGGVFVAGDAFLDPLVA